MPVGLSSVLFLYGAAARLTVRYGLEYGEGIVLWQAAHVTTPSAAYHPIEQFPYVVFHYPPVFHVMSRVMGAMTGDLLLGGRLVTLCALLGIMFSLGAIVFRSLPNTIDPTARWLGALTAALLPAALPNVRDWVPHMRVDMFGLMLSLLSMWIFLEGRTRPVLRYVAFAGFVAALFTKQTLLSAPLAALLVTVFERPRDALKLAAFAAGLGLIPLVGMQYATNGQFAMHLFVHNQNAFRFDRAVEMWMGNVVKALPVLLLAAGALIGRFRSGRDDAFRCLSIYLAFAFLVSWTVGKFGSASNYFLEFNLICCAFAGSAMGNVAADRGRSFAWTAPVFGLLLLVAGALPLSAIANDALHLTPGARALAAERESEARRALDIVREAPGPVFSWDLMVVMLAGKEIPLEPAIMFELSRAGKWDMTPFLGQIRDGYYGLIVTNSFTEWLPSDEVSQAMQFRYVPAEQFGSYHFYRPVRR